MRVDENGNIIEHAETPSVIVNNWEIKNSKL
jgi:hypothetical protein